MPLLRPVVFTLKLAGDTRAAKDAYGRFFTLWKSADPDIPILIEARREFDRLR